MTRPGWLSEAVATPGKLARRCIDVNATGRIKAPRAYTHGAPRRIEGLPAALPEPVRAYLDILPEGRIVGFPLAPLDRTGIPVWFVSLFLDGIRSEHFADSCDLPPLAARPAVGTSA